MRAPDDPAKRKRRERQRRYRVRQVASHLVVTVELTPAETAKLVRLEYIGPHELEDRKRVAEAIRALLVAIVLD